MKKQQTSCHVLHNKKYAKLTFLTFDTFLTLILNSDNETFWSLGALASALPISPNLTQSYLTQSHPILSYLTQPDPNHSALLIFILSTQLLSSINKGSHNLYLTATILISNSIIDISSNTIDENLLLFDTSSFYNRYGQTTTILVIHDVTK